MISRAVPKPVSFAPAARSRKQRVWHVANLWCKMERSKRPATALLLASALLQNPVVKLRRVFRPCTPDPFRLREAIWQYSRRVGQVLGNGKRRYRRSGPAWRRDPGNVMERGVNPKTD